MDRTGSDVVRPARRQRRGGGAAPGAILSPVSRSLPGATRSVISLNQHWRFFRGGETLDPSIAAANSIGWERVSLPHPIRLEPLNASGGRNDQGICWYVRRLELRPEWSGRVVRLCFDGAMQVAAVWLNGRQIAAHHCGYTPFTIDISDCLDFGAPDSLLVVRLDNRDDPQVPPGKLQKELDFCYFGGLYRGVRLEVVDRLHVTDAILADKVGGGGVFVTFPDVSRERAMIRVATHVCNRHDVPVECVVRQQLFDQQDRPVVAASANHMIAAGADQTFVQQLLVFDPKLWHPSSPNLYRLRTTVLHGHRPVDEVLTRIGIRHVRFDANDGMFINGERFFSLGANRHQDHPYVGYALPDSAHWRDVKKLREAGFTSCRCHYPQSPAFMDACDELGMMVIVSNPGWQFVGDEVFRQRAVYNARVMVRRDRNRPSVILWEAALNESDNSTLAAQLQHAVHEEYPGEQCYTAGDHDARIAGGWDVEFLHNDGTRPYWIREWGDHVDNWSDQQSANRVARGWGETPMLIQAWSHIRRLDELMVGHHGSASGPDAKRLCGACLWAGIDCQRGYHHQPFLGGPLDAFRLPKFGHYFFQSQRPPHVHVPGLDDGPMVFIASFATFLSPTTLTVFSNCEQVRLLRDGVEIAVQRPDTGHRAAHPPFTFNVGPFVQERSTMYMSAGIAADTEHTPVELRAEGLIGGKVVATHVVSPPGVARKIVLHADTCGRDLAADGSDWVRVYAMICDRRGTVCPFGDDLIHFSVSGEGQLIGDASIGANPMRAEAGIATTLVQSTPRSGSVRVRATAFGLDAGEIAITSSRP